MRVRNLIIVILWGLAISSCSNENMNVEDGPMITLNIEIESSIGLKSADILVNYVRFFECSNDHNYGRFFECGSEHNELRIGTVQNWDGNRLHFDLNEDEMKNVFVESYWETSLIGIDPDFLGSTFMALTGEMFEKVEIEYIEYLAFETQVDIKNGESYVVSLIMNLDEILKKSEEKCLFQTSKIETKIIQL